MICCIEDDRGIRELIVYTLNNSGFIACGFESAQGFWDFLKSDEKVTKQITLVLLDIMLPGEDGLETLKKIKMTAQIRRIPVIMVSAKSTEFDTVLGLDSGADDYISKPFGMTELIARIKAVLRRAESHVTDSTVVESKIQFNEITLDEKKRLVFIHEKPIELTFKEFELLRFFLQNPQIILTREVILETLWGYDVDSETRTVDVHIRSLRQKLADAAKYVQTIRNVGYCLTN